MESPQWRIPRSFPTSPTPALQSGASAQPGSCLTEQAYSCSCCSDLVSLDADFSQGTWAPQSCWFWKASQCGATELKDLPGLRWDDCFYCVQASCRRHRARCGQNPSELQPLCCLDVSFKPTVLMPFSGWSEKFPQNTPPHSCPAPSGL